MGHLYADIKVKGNKATKELKQVLVDTGATFTVLPENLLQEIGAWGPISKMEIGLGDGRKVKARAYGLVVEMEEVEAPAISITFEGAQAAIGVETLEAIGLRLNTATGKLEFTRPKGVAYFYARK